MEEPDENVSQQSNFMDLTTSPEIITNNNKNESVKLDRPPRNFGQINNLRSIQELPAKYRCLFEYPFFNIIQSNVLDDVLYSDVSVVISAPTGSGKTAVFELAIIRLLMNFEETNFIGDYKIIYVAPVKALCYERLSEWHTKFSKIGLSCIVLTGDSDNIDISFLRNYHIIITTPEKWDSLTRNAIRESNFLEAVKLFLIDEVHLLNDDTRGPNLEVVVSRMKILTKSEAIRFMAVSATIPNLEDIAQWLGNNDQPAVYFKIGEELRPVKLNKVVIGYPCASEIASFKFDLTLNYKLPNVIMKHAEGKPTLIFCSTRKGVELTSSHLSQNLTFHLPPSQQTLLSSASSSMFSSLHKTFLSHGVGCHHAGMSLENRSTVESLFREGHLPVLVATSTLAMGVNLPAHLVVVKGTKQYAGGSFQEYSESSLLQMIGRAGRPQFDTSATVVIMTTMKEKDRYEKMLGGNELIESNLHRHLTEHLNAEVVLGTITDIAIALEWLRYTFLYIRVLKNPKHYNIPTNFTKNQIEKKLQDWCQIEINALNKYGMLQIDQMDGFSVSPTNIGNLMANYYLAFSTMKLFTEIKGTESLSEMLMLMCRCNEFSETYLRVNDKKTLNTLNKCKYQETIRFPLKTTIKTTPMKIYCIIQATFGSIRIQNPTLCQEAIKIMRIGERIAKCVVTYLLHRDKYFFALLNALILNQCFNAKIWENSPYVSRQFPKIGTVLSSMLVSAGKTSFKNILETGARDLERIINRAPPMGNDILEAVRNLPYYKINLEPSKIDKFKIKISVTLLNSDDIKNNCTAGFNSYMTLLIGDTENNILLYKKLFHHSMATCREYAQNIEVIIKTNHVIQVYLISENWVGIDCKENYDIIINQDTEITKTAINYTNINNNSDSTSNQKSITSYFKAAKNASSIKELTKTKPKNPKTKTIDAYFTKQKNNAKNTKLDLLVPTYKPTDYLNKNKNIDNETTTNNQYLNNNDVMPDSGSINTLKNNTLEKSLPNPQNNFTNSGNTFNTYTDTYTLENTSTNPQNIFSRPENTFNNYNDNYTLENTSTNPQNHFSSFENTFNNYNDNYTLENKSTNPQNNFRSSENTFNNYNVNYTLENNSTNPQNNFNSSVNTFNNYTDSYTLENTLSIPQYNYNSSGNISKNYTNNNTLTNTLNNSTSYNQYNYNNSVDPLKNYTGNCTSTSFNPANNYNSSGDNLKHCSDNYTLENTYNYYENVEENITFDGNVSTHNEPEKNRENKQENYLENENNYLNTSQFNYESKVNENINKETFKHPYEKKIQKYFSNNKNEKKLLMKNTLSSRNTLSQPVDFESFSQNLARKFSHLSQNVENISNSHILPPSSVYSNNYCNNSTKLNVEQNNSIAKRLKTNRKIKSTLSQFQYTPPKKLSHNGARTLKKVSSDINKKLTVPYSENKDTNISSSQNYEIAKQNPVTHSQIYENYVNSSQQKTSVTNEELGKFKQFISNKNKNKQLSTVVPCTITTTNQNNELNISNITNNTNQNCSEINAIEFCDVTYEDEKINNLDQNVLNVSEEEINISSTENSQSSQCIEEIIVLSDTDDKEETDPKQNKEMPYFPKTFREYVQNSIDEQKKNTLVNQYFNYDIGFQEFLMGPLDGNSNEESSDEEDTLKSHQGDESQPKNNFQQNKCELEYSSINNTLISPEFPCDRNAENISFSASGEVINKNETPNSSIESFEHNFITDESISYSPAINNQNFSFNGLNICSNENNFQVDQNKFVNTENSNFSSESQSEFTEKRNLNVENRMKIIEQYYSTQMTSIQQDKNIFSETYSPETIAPMKKQKLSAPPLFPITRKRKYFKDPIQNNDSLKKVNPHLKKILTNYGNQYEKRISLSKNNEQEIINEPVINEVVKRTAYTYTVTIYEKEEKPIINSYKLRKQKTENNLRKANSLFKPYFRN